MKNNQVIEKVIIIFFFRINSNIKIISFDTYILLVHCLKVYNFKRVYQKLTITYQSND